MSTLIRERILYPHILPIAGCISGLAAAMSYYLSIMISQLFISHPPSTWILGLFWLPVLCLKPGLVGLVIGAIGWLIIRPFHRPRILLPTEIRTFKIFLKLLIVVSAVAGLMKIIKLSY